MNAIIRKSIIGQCLAEFLGTFIFLSIGMGAVAGLQLAGASYGQWEISIIWGMAVALAVYLTAAVSGAHLNPAVTIALWVFTGFSWRKVIPYIIAQMCGAFCAAALVFGLYYNVLIEFETLSDITRGSQESLVLAGIFTTYPHPALSFISAFMVEMTITAILMGMIMALTDNNNGIPRGALAPLLIGVVIAVIGGAFGPLTGFAMNPARDFAPKIFTYLAGWGELALTGGKEIPYFIVPLIAPIVGACLGAIIYKTIIGFQFNTKS